MEQNGKLKKLMNLFYTFAKIGMFTFGGGYAMIGIIEHECVEKKKWITSDEMMDMTVIAESTPGPIAINCSTYVGYKQAKMAGAIAATIGMALPSFVIIYLISMFLDNFLEIEIVANAFKGIKIGVGILIVHAAFNMFKKMKKKAIPIILMVGAMGTILFNNICSWGISSIHIMIAAAAINLLIFMVKGGAKS